MLKKIKTKIIGGNNILLYITSKVCNFIGRNKIKGKNNNQILLEGNYLKKCTIKIHGKNNKIILEKNGCNLLLNVNIYIAGNNNLIILGSKNYINKGDFYIEDDNNIIRLGNHNTIAGFTHLAAIEGKEISFKNNCLFSSNVIFRVGDSHSILSLNTNKRINPSKSIHVGNRVWFGNNTTILKGVSLANDTIIATGAIVTKSFEEPNTIIGGSPAKVIKDNICWKNERI